MSYLIGVLVATEPVVPSGFASHRTLRDLRSFVASASGIKRGLLLFGDHHHDRGNDDCLASGIKRGLLLFGVKKNVVEFGELVDGLADVAGRDSGGAQRRVQGFDVEIHDRGHPRRIG